MGVVSRKIHAWREKEVPELYHYASGNILDWRCRSKECIRNSGPDTCGFRFIPLSRFEKAKPGKQFLAFLQSEKEVLQMMNENELRIQQ